MPINIEDYYGSLSKYGWGGPQSISAAPQPPQQQQFNSQAYWDANPDVASHKEYGSSNPAGAQAHYNKYGRGERRDLGLDVWNQAQAQQQAQVQAQATAQAQLETQQGIQSGAPSLPAQTTYDFNVESYLQANPKLQKYQDTHSDFDPTAHWTEFGETEGRSSGQSDAYNYYQGLDPSLQEEFKSLPQEEQDKYVNYVEEDYPTPTNEFINRELPLAEYDVSQEAFEGSPQYINMINQMERQRKESTTMASARGYRNDPRLQLELNRRGAQEAQLRYQDFYNNTRQRYGDEYNREIDQYKMDSSEFTDYYNRFAGIAGVGQTASAGLNSLGASTANSQAFVRGTSADYYGNSLIGAGYQGAQGQLAVGDAWGSAAGALGDWWANREPQGGYGAGGSVPNGGYGGWRQ